MAIAQPASERKSTETVENAQTGSNDLATTSSSPYKPLPHSHVAHRLPAKNRPSPLGSRRGIRNPIRRLRKDSRTTRSRRRAMGIRRRIRKSEAPLTERIPIDFAKIIADIPIALIRILKLQDIARPFRRGDFERMTPIGRRTVRFRVCARVGVEGVSAAAACWMLYADVKVGGEAAFVDNECLSRGP